MSFKLNLPVIKNTVCTYTKKLGFFPDSKCVHPEAGLQVLKILKK